MAYRGRPCSVYLMPKGAEISTPNELESSASYFLDGTFMSEKFTDHRSLGSATHAN